MSTRHQIMMNGSQAGIFAEKIKTKFILKMEKHEFEVNLVH